MELKLSDPIKKHVELMEKYQKTHNPEDKKNLREYEIYLRDNNLAIIDYGVSGAIGPRGPKSNKNYEVIERIKENREKVQCTCEVRGAKGDIGSPKGPRSYKHLLKFYGLKKFIIYLIIKGLKNKLRKKE